MFKRIIFYIFLITIGTKCWAGDCIRVDKYPVISFSGAVQVSPSAAIGSAIATGTTTTTFTNLTPQSTSTLVFYWAQNNISGVTYSSNGASVHPTNLNGVGISVWTDTHIPKGNDGVILQQTYDGTINAKTYNMYYALVKTANITASGTVNSTVFNMELLGCTTGSGGMSNFAYQIINITGGPTVSIKACTINNPSINVSLGTAKRTAFSGVGSTANTQSFNVSLTCSQATTAKITLAPGSSGAFNAATGIINLDTPTSGVSAKGIGIQMLYNNAVLPLNSAVSVGSVVAAGTLTIPLSARYYQTASTVTAGVANGTATFTMTYN